MDKENEIPVLTVEELMGAAEAKLIRNLTIELENGKTINRKVIFKRLTYKEITGLSKVPESRAEEYVKLVVKFGSVEPMFPTVEELDNYPNFFLQHYSRMILKESGKNPFLSQASPNS